MKVHTELKRSNTEETGQGSVLQCNICYKKFSKTYNLNRHVVLHTGNFRWYCEKCRKGFAQKEMYIVHKRLHEGLKYKCEYCGKSFTQQVRLKYHMSEHTGNYRFKCDFCGKGFNRLPLYEKHTAAHESA